LGIEEDQWSVLRWEFDRNQKLQADGSGLLELTTYSISQGGNFEEVYGEDFGMEFGKVRIIEIFGGESNWDQSIISYKNFLEDSSYEEMFNTQMIFDFEVSELKGSRNFITLSRPVLQRMLNGKTKGLLIRPLGAINASFFASESGIENSPKLYFNLIKK